MTMLLMFIHALVCVFLISIILMQSGRGGGLTETFSSAESVFGAKTSEFLIRATTVLVTLFIVTCLSLAYISSKKDKSLMLKKFSTQGQKKVNKAAALAPSASQQETQPASETPVAPQESSAVQPAATQAEQSNQPTAVSPEPPPAAAEAQPQPQNSTTNTSEPATPAGAVPAAETK